MEFANMLDEAQKLFKTTERLRVFVGGNTPEVDVLSHAKHDDAARGFLDDKELAVLSNLEGSSKENREFVESKLREKGFQVTKISYAQPSESTILRIDTRTGNVEYLTEEE